MDSPLISCVIPAFNGERYLRQAIDSVLAQSYRPIELILIDDGSTDATPAIAGSYGESIRYIRQSNGGPAAARNLGLSAARGQFVSFLDQDDLWLPEKLARQMGRFREHPELDLSVTHLTLLWVAALQEEEVRFREHRITRPLPGYITGTLLARVECFKNVGWFNPDLRYGDAMEWFLRAAEEGAIIELLPDVLLRHRMHPSNLSRREASGSRDEFLHILKSVLDRRRHNNASSASNMESGFAVSRLLSMHPTIPKQKTRERL